MAQQEQRISIGPDGSLFLPEGVGKKEIEGAKAEILLGRGIGRDLDLFEQERLYSLLEAEDQRMMGEAALSVTVTV